MATNLPTLLQTRRKQHRTHEQRSVFSTHHLGETSSSKLRSRNRPSVCTHPYHHHTAPGSCLKTAQPPHSPPITSLDLATMKLGTAGSGHKTVNRTRQTAIWHRSRETVILTMLTIDQHSLTYLFYCLPSPTILLKIWYNRGGLKSA
jgi:hypothetical protein